MLRSSIPSSLIPRITLMTLAMSYAQTASSQDLVRPVPSVGAMKDITDAGEKPDPKVTYRIVFDVQTSGDSDDDVSPALQSIGGLINTYRGYGVPASHLQATAVFHGRTILLVAKDEVYARRTGTTTNPNTPILRELAAAGVQLVVCGQSAMAQHYTSSDYLLGVRTNLSATVTFLNLQTRGYVKITE